MASLIYPGPHEAVILPGGRKVNRGESAEIDDEAVAASLVEQGWTSPKPDKAAPKKPTQQAAKAIPKE